MQEERMQGQDTALIEGRNPVWEALKAERPMEKLIISKAVDQRSIAGITGAARRQKIRIEFAPKEKLDRLSQTGRHQGIIAIASVRAFDDFADALQALQGRDRMPFLVFLDEIEDPHNLGAIIRSAECAGADMVVIPAHNSVGLTPVVARASAGAVEHMTVCRVSNLTQALQQVKDMGIWVVGADMDGQDVYQSDLNRPLALVVGSEGRGIRRLVREQCDFAVRLPLMGKTSSLNASVAAGVLMYEALRQRGAK